MTHRPARPLRTALTALLVAAATALTAASPALAQTAPPVERAPLVTVTSRTIDVGGTTDLTVAAGGAGRVVDLYAGSARAPFRVIRTATLAAYEDGSAGWRLQPGENTSFYAQVRGAQRSPTLTVGVRRTVTIGIRQAGGVHTFSGAVARPEPGVQVTIARLGTDGRVVGVASTRTGADGRYALRTALPGGMAGYYALTAASSDLLPGRSRLYGLRVPLPAPGSACSATASRSSYDDSARCLYRALVRRDRAMALNYATPAAATDLLAIRTDGDPGWSYQGCGRPILVTPSSGLSCKYYDRDATPVHGVDIEFAMARDLRVEAIGFVG